MSTVRSRLVALVVAVFFLGGNLAGAGFAAAQGELLHASIHAALALLAAALGWRLARGRGTGRSWRRGEVEVPAVPAALTDRLTHLEQSVDTVAVEVERIGEGQRYMTRLFTERGTPTAPGAGGAAGA